MRDEKGFVPFSAVGFIILMLVVALLGHAALARHERSLSSLEETEATSALATATSIQNDLQDVARYAVYRALWDVSKCASDYASDVSRELVIEDLASDYFTKLSADLPETCNRLDARVELELASQPTPQGPHHILLPDGTVVMLAENTTRPIFDLQQVDDGFASSKVRLPNGTRVRANSWDNTLTLEFPFENFDVFIDSRYYLLQNRMGEFIGNGLEGIRETWRNIEYLLAWAGAWTSLGVNLNEARSKAIFELAWAKQELDTFGSADYIATAMKLLGIGEGNGGSEDVLSTISNPPVATPLRAVDLEAMKGFIDRALGCLSSASSDLATAKARLANAKESVIQIPDNAENTALIENARRELEATLDKFSQSKNHVREARQQFDQLVEFTAQAAGSDVIMAAIHDSLTQRPSGDYVRGDYPSLQEQVTWGAAGAENKISELEAMVRPQLQITSSDNITSIKNSISNLYTQAETCVPYLLVEPSPKRWVEFDVYDEPGACDETPSPTSSAVPVYMDSAQDGTIGAMEVVLQGVNSNLEKMRVISETTEPSPDELRDVEIDEELEQKLGTDTHGFLGIDREGLYELLPPPPIRDQPGLSVFHDFNIKSPIRYQREDPAGRLFGQNAPPTPIWLIFFTLWYAQWEVTLELQENPIEEIFDFANPTLPRPHELAEIFGNEIVTDVHKPLAYRCGVQRRTFSFKLILLSLRPFNVSSS